MTDTKRHQQPGECCCQCGSTSDFLCVCNDDRIYCDDCRKELLASGGETEDLVVVTSLSKELLCQYDDQYVCNTKTCTNIDCPLAEGDQLNHITEADICTT